MSTHIDHLIQTIKTQGTLLSHQHPDATLEVGQFMCSTFIPEKKLLIKGECDKPNSLKRQALLVFWDLDSGKVKGGSQ